MLKSISDVARELSCSEQTVRQKIALGLWPSYRLGPKSTRLDVDEIKKIAAADRQSEEQTGGVK
jgi:hypothetical protein